MLFLLAFLYTPFFAKIAILLILVALCFKRVPAD